MRIKIDTLIFKLYALQDAWWFRVFGIFLLLLVFERVIELIHWLLIS
jgi:hypothetical protein